MENERVNRVSPSQRMHLLNSSHIQRKLEDSPLLKRLFDPGRRPQTVVEELYLTVLSRFPTAAEYAAAEAYAKTGAAKGREAYIDLTWALLNSDEFLYRH
jgi:hypothetical protein